MEGGYLMAIHSFPHYWMATEPSMGPPPMALYFKGSFAAMGGLLRTSREGHSIAFLLSMLPGTSKWFGKGGHSASSHLPMMGNGKGKERGLSF